MCGIFGSFGRVVDDGFATAFSLLAARGRDALGATDGQEVFSAVDPAGLFDLMQGKKEVMVHALHAIVGHRPQPIAGKGFLVANCEIYNWRALAAEYGLTADNDAHLLSLLFDALPVLDESSVHSLIARLDGVFALAYWRGDELVVARDVVGVKPLWFSHQDGFSFASERKVLVASGVHDAMDLHPRVTLKFSLSTGELSRWRRPFFVKGVLRDDPKDVLAGELAVRFRQAVLKRIPSGNVKVGVLFSGGLDSSLIAKVCKDAGFETVCYTAVVDNPRGKDPHDLTASRAVAVRYGLSHKVLAVAEEDVESLAHDTATLIEEAHAVKVAVGMPFLAACRQAKSDGCKVLFSGLGAEELFAGYQRHRDSSDVNDECLAGLMWMYERDLYRDDVITMRSGVELRVPFLDHELVRFSLSLPASLKLHDGVEKYLLRKAALLLGLEQEDAFRPKKAAQYGSRFDHALERLARSYGLNRVQYLRTLLPVANKRLGVLCSGGKDSWYAAYVMKRLNYDLACCLTMKSDNDDSYMFHTPAIDLVKLQCEAANIPLLEQSTLGVKEEELADLRELLLRGKEQFGIDGVVTGALFSQYQRERVERLCAELGLKPYAPLWHLDQESELRELLREGFVITMSAIAGQGVDQCWLGKEVGEVEVEALMRLKRSIGFNVAGEGGEYESLVLDCPLFAKRLVVEGQADMENEFTGRLRITKATLTDK